MAYNVNYGAPLEPLARLARALGERQGQETARQQGVAEQNQQIELDQAQQRIGVAQQEIRSRRDIQELQGRQAADRIRLEYDRRAEENLHQQEVNEATNARANEYTLRSDWMKTATPEGQREMRALLLQEQQMRAGIGSQYTLDQVAPLAQELQQKFQAVMSNPAYTQQPLTPQQRFEQSSVTLDDGTIIAYDDENKPHLMLRHDQSAQRYDQSARADLFKNLTHDVVDAAGNTRTVYPTRAEFDAAWEAVSGGAVPDELPTGAAAEPMVQAAAALGFDLSKPATPEQRVALQQYLAQQQGGQQPAPTAAAEPEPTAPQQAGPSAPGPIDYMVLDAAQAIQSGETLPKVADAVAGGLGLPAAAAAPVASAIVREAEKIARTARVPVEMAIGQAIRNILSSWRGLPRIQ